MNQLKRHVRDAIFGDKVMIKSKIDGRDYLFQIDDEDNYKRSVRRINKNKTDASLRRLRNAMTVICDELEKVYEGNYSLYDLIRDEYVFCGSLQLEDGEIYWLRAARDRIAELETMLQTQNDELDYIPPKEMITLSDLGYKAITNSTPFYEKTIEDNDEQEVVEEILVGGSGEYIRRKRTVLWERTNYGKSSKSIKYKKLPIGKRLYKAIQNTLLSEWKYANISEA